MSPEIVYKDIDAEESLPVKYQVFFRINSKYCKYYW